MQPSVGQFFITKGAVRGVENLPNLGKRWLCRNLINYQRYLLPEYRHRCDGYSRPFLALPPKVTPPHPGMGAVKVLCV